jgi:hypothetical protein
VPTTTLTGPELLAAEELPDPAALDVVALEVLDDELLLPPQALIATAATAVSSHAADGLTYLFTDPPPEVRVPRPHNLIPSRRGCEQVPWRRPTPNQGSTTAGGGWLRLSRAI